MLLLFLIPQFLTNGIVSWNIPEACPTQIADIVRVFFNLVHYSKLNLPRPYTGWIPLLPPQMSCFSAFLQGKIHGHNELGVLIPIAIIWFNTGPMESKWEWSSTLTRADFNLLIDFPLTNGKKFFAFFKGAVFPHPSEIKIYSSLTFYPIFLKN